jgi:hypothetical protein
MVELTEAQRKVKNKITWQAVVIGVIVGAIAAVLIYLIGGNWNTAVRWIATLLVGAGLGYVVYRWTYQSGVTKSVCPKCGTAFGIREVERKEELLSTETKFTSEQVKGDKVSGPQTKSTTWTEDKFKVTAIDECSNCNNRTERSWTETRERDKVERTS